MRLRKLPTAQHSPPTLSVLPELTIFLSLVWKPSYICPLRSLEVVEISQDPKFPSGHASVGRMNIYIEPSDHGKQGIDF